MKYMYLSGAPCSKCLRRQWLVPDKYNPNLTRPKDITDRKWTTMYKANEKLLKDKKCYICTMGNKSIANSGQIDTNEIIRGFGYEFN